LPGHQLFIGHATVQPLGWKIVLVVPVEEFIAPANESASKILSEMKELWTSYIHILVFLLLGVIGISLVTFMHQSRGLRTLLQAIHILGEGDLSHRVPEDHTELGRLAKALNSMARSLLEKKAELQRVIAEVEQGRKLTAVGRLAAGVAHEVNNPLATISTYTQLLLWRSDLPQDVPKDLRKVMGEIQRIQSKLRDLLDLSRLQSPVMTEQDPNVIIQEVTDLVSHDAMTRGIALDLVLAPERTILVDRSGLKQVVWNLLGNALEAQEQGGRIAVRTFFEEDKAAQHLFVLEVEDEGPGIPESVLPHIFEPFFTSKEFGKGTGLGLAIVYSIVKGHDGTIEVRNLEPKGCRFRATFPGKRNQ
ncbi:MAG: HAMP domain-containing sensor histidine kinase, partial [Desulfuromonadaceae bacterium]